VLIVVTAEVDCLRKDVLVSTHLEKDRVQEFKQTRVWMWFLDGKQMVASFHAFVIQLLTLLILNTMTNHRLLQWSTRQTLF